MRKLMQLCGCAALVAGVGFAAPGAQAGEAYAWTTEDGVYAYTDDPKKVPSRYRDQAVRIHLRDLDQYDRFTKTHDDASAAVEEHRVPTALARCRSRLLPLVGPGARIPRPGVVEQVAAEQHHAAVAAVERGRRARQGQGVHRGPQPRSHLVRRLRGSGRLRRSGALRVPAGGIRPEGSGAGRGLGRTDP